MEAAQLLMVLAEAPVWLWDELLAPAEVLLLKLLAPAEVLLLKLLALGEGQLLKLLALAEVLLLAHDAHQSLQVLFEEPTLEGCKEDCLLELCLLLLRLDCQQRLTQLPTSHTSAVAEG